MNVIKQKKKAQQQGVSLLEIMVALAIGLLVIAGVVRVMSHSITKNKMLKAENEIQEILTYADNRLAFIFKEAMSSPCGSLTEMLAETSHPYSQLKKASFNAGAQPIPNIIFHDSVESTSKVDIFKNEFPMVLPGIKGGTDGSGLNEPLDGEGEVISKLLPPSLPVGSQYIVMMEISEKIIINPVDSDGVEIKAGAVEGGKGKGKIMKNRQSIPTSTIVDGVGTTNVPFIITDCKKGDIFMPNQAVESDGIPVDDGLRFQGHYKPNSTIISPVRIYAYYVAPDNDGINNFMRTDLMSGESQSLVAGIQNIDFLWGLGKPDKARVQAYFSTQQVLEGGGDLQAFRDNVISVKITLTAQGVNNVYKSHSRDWSDSGSVSEFKNSQRSVSRAYTIRNKMERI